MTLWQSRTELLIGKDSSALLEKAKIALFGVGGVGSYCFEALVRAGIGEIHIFDGDVVAESNLNRQLIATTKNIGRSKVEVSKERAEKINPSVKIYANKVFYLPEIADNFPFEGFDYVIDAVDTVTAKLEIIKRAKRAGVKVISCMGTGNKLDPTLFKVADIYKTKVCPLAKVMRKELKALGIDSLKVVYSEEEPIIKTRTPSSISFVPSVAGLILAGEVIKEIIRNH